MNLSGKFKIGRLDRKITFRNFTVSRDDYGDEILTWADVLTTRASIDYRSGGTKEAVEVERETAFNTVNFVIRQRSVFTPTAKMKIVFDGSEYDIQSIQELPETRNRFWLIVARKIDASDP